MSHELREFYAPPAQTNDTSSYRQDTAGGLYDFPLREYSTQGRWPNPDPLGRSAICPKDPQTQNRYAYVRNNPMTHTDPTGGHEVYCDPDEDPFCPCDIFPLGCIPIGGGGGFSGGGGGGGSPERPRPFPWPYLPLGFFSSLNSADAGDTPEGKCWNDWNACYDNVDKIMNGQVKKHKEELRGCVKDCTIALLFGGEAYVVCLKVCALIWDAGAAADVAARDLGYRICDARLDNCLKQAGAPPR